MCDALQFLINLSFLYPFFVLPSFLTTSTNLTSPESNFIASYSFISHAPTSGGNQVGNSTNNFAELSNSPLHGFGEFLGMHKV